MEKYPGEEVNYMTDKPVLQFIDTNIFIYAYDCSSPEKQRKAKELVLNLWENQNGCISVQVLQEFYVNIVYKVPVPLPVKEALMIITDLSCWYLHTPSASDVIETINIQQNYRISFWDAMIINSAKKMGCNILWTEDLNEEQVIEGVIIKNPF